MAADVFTWRERVIAERFAFQRGYSQGARDFTNYPEMHDRACKEYPLPPIQRPRRWVDRDGHTWRVLGTDEATKAPVIQMRRNSFGEWHTWPNEFHGALFTAAHIAPIADLIAHPTEEVPDVWPYDGEKP